MSELAGSICSLPFARYEIQYLSVSFKHAIDLDYYLLIFNLSFRGPPSRDVINPSFLQLPSPLPSSADIAASVYVM